MNHYNCSDSSALIVPVHCVLMTKAIGSAISANGVPVRGFKRDPDNTGFSLHKLDDMREAFDSNCALPPISVIVRRDAHNNVYYSIRDGRHRFAMSVIHGFVYIPVILL